MHVSQMPYEGCEKTTSSQNKMQNNTRWACNSFWEKRHFSAKKDF